MVSECPHLIEDQFCYNMHFLFDLARLGSIDFSRFKQIQSYKFELLAMVTNISKVYMYYGCISLRPSTF